MASGTKSSMPEVIFVIYNGYEYRTYTTILAFAQAITDGYAEGRNTEVKVFVPADWADDGINVGVQQIAKRKPFQHQDIPQWVAVSPPAGNYQAWNNLTPAQEAASKANLKAEKAGRKAHKDKLVAALTQALGRTF